MTRKWRVEECLGIFLLIGAVVLAGSPIAALAGHEEPQPGENLSGPAIPGTVTVVAGNEGNATFMGMCKNQPVTLVGNIPLSPGDLAAVTASGENGLEGFRSVGSGPPGCHSDVGGEDLIINTVTKFSNTGTVVTADVIVLFVVPR